MLHPTRHGDGDGDAASHLPAEIPIGEQLQTTLVPLQTAWSEVAAARGTLPPPPRCWCGELWGTHTPSAGASFPPLRLSCLLLKNGN